MIARIGSLIVGVFFMVIGSVGILLPVLPGWIFLFIGLSLIAPRLARRLKRGLLRRWFKQDTVILREWRRYRVHAGFTTKHFPLFLTKTDELLDLSHQNRFKDMIWKGDATLEPAMGSSKRFVFMRQVHGDNIVTLDNEAPYRSGGFYHFPEADGLITNVPGLTLLVMTADCLPVYFCAVRSNGRRLDSTWIGLIHAGWRGTQKGIAKKAFQMIVEKAQCRPADVRIAFGPCIGRRRYEVGPEFEKLFHRHSMARRGGKWYFDLAGENRRQLLSAGARESRILDPKICTVDENRDFYSFRKEKAGAGRMVSFLTKYPEPV